jgi:hypothetical protein
MLKFNEFNNTDSITLENLVNSFLNENGELSDCFIKISPNLSNIEIITGLKSASFKKLTRNERSSNFWKEVSEGLVKFLKESGYNYKEKSISTFGFSLTKDDNLNFDDMKSNILSKLDEFISEYDQFTKNVSSKNWRQTGNHFGELKKMKSEILDFKESNESDRMFMKKYEE